MSSSIIVILSSCLAVIRESKEGNITYKMIDTSILDTIYYIYLSWLKSRTWFLVSNVSVQIFNINTTMNTFIDGPVFNLFMDVHDLNHISNIC